MWYTCVTFIVNSTEIGECDFTAVGKLALKFYAVELVRLICWVTDCAGELWAFPERKCWKHFHFGENTWPNQSTTRKSGGSATAQEKESGGGRETPSDSTVRFTHSALPARGWGWSGGVPRELPPRGKTLPSLGDVTLAPNLAMRFLSLYVH